jgi:hypothetical protein
MKKKSKIGKKKEKKKEKLGKKYKKNYCNQ